MFSQIITASLIFILAIFLSIWITLKIRDSYWKKHLASQRKDAILRSRSVLAGHFSENLAPYLPNFPFSPTECRFIGKPLDFIVFRGMDKKDIKEIIFVEVKSGKSKLSFQEKNLKNTIKDKKVRFEEYRVPKDLTDKKDVGNKLGNYYSISEK